MADIELVIKIPESQYKTLHAKTQADVVDVIDDKLLIDAIKNGMPLSKGHGDLVDRKELLSHEKCTYRYDCPGSSCDKCSDNCVEVRDIENAKPVIKASKEIENE